MLKGKQLNLSIGGTRLAHSRGCVVDRKTDTIEVCSPTDGAARRYLPTTTSWAISANGLFANKEAAERLRQLWRDRQPVNISYVTDEAVVERGSAILIHLQETGNYNELVKFSIQLQGSGALENQNGVHVPLNSFDGGEDARMWMDGQLNIRHNEQGYEILTAVVGPDERVHLQIIGACDWFVFEDVNESFVQDYIARGDTGIEQDLLYSGTNSSYLYGEYRQQYTIVISHRVGDPIEVLRYQ